MKLETPCREFIRSNGIKPKKMSATGALYSVHEINTALAKSMIYTNYFYDRAKNMASDMEKATEYCEEVAANLDKAIKKFSATQVNFSDQSKKMAGEIKAASERMAQGLQRIEKAANFERLERYVELLERAANAMTILGELEKTGKLDKIATAIR